MSLQNLLNEQTINLLPIVRHVLTSIDEVSYASLKRLTIAECLNSGTPIVDMNDQQLIDFQKNILENFKAKMEYMK